MTALQTTRLRSVDALRGIAALGVVLYHAIDKSEVLPANSLRYPMKFIQFLSSFGYIGVFLFFVISGFCIHLQWCRSRSINEQGSVAFGKFWKRRIKRLYPPYVIALVLFVSLTALSIGFSVSRFSIYDLAMHLLMLHNFDPRTCYTIKGVFWTLAIEEQLYLAYFLLLFLRKRWGWAVTLTVCLLARGAWMTFSHVVWLKSGIGVPVPEAAASHWFTWALGAIAVEAWFGLVKLPRWTRDLRIATFLIVSASAMAYFGPSIPKDTFWHISSWFLLHPLWGIGFFIVLNRAVLAEDGWIRALKLPSLISVFATLGVFSYSIYLTHELTIMQSWRFVNPAAWQMQNVFLITIPATIVFAWVFFWFCERPFMSKRMEARRDVEIAASLIITESPEHLTA
jgi:peptidoglycan/LPS O-acetylase OafA/YrhL